MTHGFNHTSSEASKDEWLTPPHIIRALGIFDLDPCAPHSSRRPWPTAENHYSGFTGVPEQEAQDGLFAPWEGRIWCNPPYGNQTFDWMKRCADHGNAIALIFARTETKGFHAEIWNKADAVFFFRGRLAFHHVDGTKGDTANAPSCLVAYGESNVAVIATSGLAGILVRTVKPVEAVNVIGEMTMCGINCSALYNVPEKDLKNGKPGENPETKDKEPSGEPAGGMARFAGKKRLRQKRPA